MPSESERVPIALRRTVASRANHLCEYCRCPEEFSPDSFTVEHIKPRQAGGKTIGDRKSYTKMRWEHPNEGKDTCFCQSFYPPSPP